MRLNAPTVPEASASDSPPLMGLAYLMRQVFSGIDLTPLGEALLRRASDDANDANALMDLATILHFKGSHEVALEMQAQALTVRRHYVLAPVDGSERIRLLAIMTPGELMANTPVEFLMEGTDIALHMIYVAPGETLPPSLPDHDVMIIAVAESDDTKPLLGQLERATRSWSRPVLNRPEHIARLARDRACALLRSVPGAVMPACVRADRELLQRIGRAEVSIDEVLGDGEFPIIVRPVGSHAGHGLVKLDGPASVAGYLEGSSSPAFYLCPFVDYRGRDGLFRKYRVVFIEGRPFAAHMAISDSWMVHYLNAGMTESEERRAEEARFMAGFERDFACRHKAAMRAVSERLELDYFGIDCGETSDGRLLIFEADSALVVHALDPVDRFAYKQLPMRKLFCAFRQMLLNATQRGAP